MSPTLQPGKRSGLGDGASVLGMSTATVRLLRPSAVVHDYRYAWRIAQKPDGKLDRFLPRLRG